MPTEIVITKTQLNPKNASINVKELADTISDLLEEFNYDTEEDSYKYDGQPGEVKDLDIRISGAKAIDDYTRFKIETSIVFGKSKQVEEKSGSKKNLIIIGDGKITLVAKLVLDYDNKWAKSPVLHWLEGIYRRYFYFAKRKGFAAKLAKELFSIEGDLRSYLKME